MADRFEARVSKGRTLLLILGAVAMAAVSSWLIVDAQEIAETVPWIPDAGLAQVIGGAGVLLFLLFGVVGVRQLFRTEPVIEMSREGLLWRRWSSETIPWDAFDRAAVMSIQRQRMLTLWLRDPDAHRSTTFSGRTAGANKALGFGDISLSASGLDCSFDALVAGFEANAGPLAQRD